MNIGEQIKRYRKKKNLTQNELAQKLDLSQETIFNWENNLETPTEDDINKIIKVLGVSKKQFFKGLNNNLYREEIPNKAFQELLLPEEKIMWQGKPYFHIHRFSFSTFIFSFFFISFAIFWTIMASLSSLFMGFFGIPFIIIGISIFVSSLKTKSKPLIYYLVTNKRLLIVDNLNLNRYQEIKISDLSKVVLRKGFGFFPSLSFYTTNSLSFSDAKGFFIIKDALYVKKIIDELRNEN